MDDALLRRLLQDCRTIAVFGLSADPARPSHGVARYLQKHGYRIIPVNPKYAEVLGEKCYPDLGAIPEPVDLVDVFRRPDDCLEPARGAVAIGARVLWLQLGVVNEWARRMAESSGLVVVMDRCLKIEHMRLLGNSN